MPGQGKVDFPVTTAKPEAQAFINQGVAQLHSFYYFEAERSFRQAAKIDPDCAMAYWGMAMANVNNAKRARGFLKEAREARRPRLTRREKLYLDALEALYKEGATTRTGRQGPPARPGDDRPGVPRRPRRPRLAGDGDLAERRPDGIGSRQAVDTRDRTVLEVEPMHPGAHHYRIHLWDGVKPTRAETVGRRSTPRPPPGSPTPGTCPATPTPG